VYATLRTLAGSAHCRYRGLGTLCHTLHVVDHQLAEAARTLDLTGVLDGQRNWRHLAWITQRHGADAHRRMLDAAVADRPAVVPMEAEGLRDEVERRATGR
jgi:Family of unknown function (DUF6247)